MATCSASTAARCWTRSEAHARVPAQRVAAVLVAFHRPIHRDAAGAHAPKPPAAVAASDAAAAAAAAATSSELYPVLPIGGVLEGVRLLAALLLLQAGPAVAEPLVAACPALPALLLYHSQTMDARSPLVREWAVIALRALVQHSAAAGAELARMKESLSRESAAAAAMASA